MDPIQEVQSLDTLRTHSVSGSCILLLLLLVSPMGCMTYPRVSVDRKKVDLIHVQTDIPESHLLDVRIQIFNPGKLPSSKNASRGLSEEIRIAESQYMAIQLKKTLQKTGHWGAVRVIPTESSGDEVLVTGRIVKSNGEELKLEIEASDAMSMQWFKKSFKGAVNIQMYDESSKEQTEVFQNVYNQIANKLGAYREEMESDRVREIRQVAEMRFAEQLAPAAFSGYLKEGEKKGQIKIDRLPSEDDEMLARVRRVRERDYMLVDTLDAHYESLDRMNVVYTDWRKSRLVEMNVIREVDDRKNKQKLKAVALVTAGIVLGALGGQSQGYNPGWSSAVGGVAAAGVTLLLDADRISEEAEINKTALEELGISFAADVEPTVLEVEGQTVELTGSAEAKYEQWREVLGKLYQIESGPDIEIVDPM